uniref:Uncharacterized protein n=1 Tax=Anopheles culicifacies TaxID=139723 RepID=A0A182MQH2_9DIPT
MEALYSVRNWTTSNTGTGPEKTDISLQRSRTASSKPSTNRTSRHARTLVSVVCIFLLYGEVFLTSTEEYAARVEFYLIPFNQAGNKSPIKWEATNSMCSRMESVLYASGVFAIALLVVSVPDGFRKEEWKKKNSLKQLGGLGESQPYCLYRRSEQRDEKLRPTTPLVKHEG